MNINKNLTKYNLSKWVDGTVVTRRPSDIKYIVIHYVGALGDAKGNAEYYASRYLGASAHYYVGFTGDVWQSVDDLNISWHAGVDWSNGTAPYWGKCTLDNSIGIEMCVRKKSTTTMNSTDRDWYFEDATVKSAIELTKMLMKKYNVPASRVIRHYDVCGKICPNPYVYNNTKHTWNAFKKAISKNTASYVANKVLYRIRKTWSDAKSQIGAYKNINNAKEDLKDGYGIYDEKGNIVYAKAKANCDQYMYKQDYTWAYWCNIEKGATVEILHDDGCGMCKIRYNGHIGYTYNFKLDRDGMSKCLRYKVIKTTYAYTESNDTKKKRINPTRVLKGRILAKEGTTGVLYSVGHTWARIKINGKTRWVLKNRIKTIK